jgi:hypothetical protein
VYASPGGGQIKNGFGVGKNHQVLHKGGHREDKWKNSLPLFQVIQNIKTTIFPLVFMDKLKFYIFWHREGSTTRGGQWGGQEGENRLSGSPEYKIFVIFS